MLYLTAFVVCVVLPGSTAYSAEPTPFRVVGYLPEYRASEFDWGDAAGLTDLILFSAEPGVDGKLDLTRLRNVPWAKARAFKTRQRVRLLLCVGGWERSANFARVASSAEARQKFVQSALRICLDERLDGIDSDWEHPKNEREQSDYAELLDACHRGFQPHGLMLSVTIAAWQQLPRSAFAAVDAVHVMAYDHPERHATFESAQADLKKVIELGAPKAKIVLGLPLYGRHVSKHEQAHAYRDILQRYQPLPDSDEIDAIYFNGPTTIRRKTQYARDAGLGGVMLWELGQDALGKHSLLRVVGETVMLRRQK